ncbi:hexose kinase [Ornithinibacillus sp. L9]|uniref:Tagatose-6-phosphate kinase n=1 Tax=Ornithinibacillus caprae TaxID=2678566 RepID=A0A6N8FHC8_9BACI|nr:1-phosphofructokinase family hexose kinase [Ornithinibacillus caprae]MUK87467.1 hexose kinase [Ornithinibacillus caprae]
MNYTITLNPAIDRLIFLDEKMENRKTNRITDVAYDIGGKGTHGSYAMTKLNVKNKALGFMGGLNSDKFQRILETKGISNGFTTVKGQATRECYVVIDRDSTGTTMLTEKGLKVSRNDVDTFQTNLKKIVNYGDFVLIAGSLPVGFFLEDLKKMIKILKETGCFVACDLSGDALKLATEVGVDFIKPNEFEIRELNDKEEELIPFLKKLNKKISYIVVSLGQEGSYCIHDGEVYRVKSPFVKEVNDTGAGDCFVGAFLAGIIMKQTIEETLRLASACAASKVMHNDSSTFNLNEVERLIHQVEISKY